MVVTYDHDEGIFIYAFSIVASNYWFSFYQSTTNLSGVRNRDRENILPNTEKDTATEKEERILLD